MKTSQPKLNRSSLAWLRAVMNVQPMTAEAHAALRRQQTVTRRTLEDLREKREANMDPWR